MSNEDQHAALQKRVAALKKALHDMVFAYTNKDEFPHMFELSALDAAADLLPGDKLVQKVRDERRAEWHDAVGEAALGEEADAPDLDWRYDVEP